jgi:hypothetical protein
MPALTLPAVRAASNAARILTACNWCPTKLPYQEAQQAGWVAWRTGDTHRYACPSCYHTLAADTGPQSEASPPQSALEPVSTVPAIPVSAHKLNTTTTITDAT